MDDPVKDISDVILALTTTPPSVQQAAIDKYFTSDAEFGHPFCRTSPASNSRFQVARIYRWYKIMSPQISIKIHSIAFDRERNLLYVGISQIFAIWAVPLHEARVSLVTVLTLVQQDNRLVTNGKSASNPQGSAGGKYYIKRQEDLYQTDQFVRFLVPQLAFITLWLQYLATFVCIACSYIFWPVTWLEENRQTHFQRDQQPPAWSGETGR